MQRGQSINKGVYVINKVCSYVYLVILEPSPVPLLLELSASSFLEVLRVQFHLLRRRDELCPSASSSHIIRSHQKPIESSEATSPEPRHHVLAHVHLPPLPSLQHQSPVKVYP
jgi:hypothetical protein